MLGLSQKVVINYDIAKYLPNTSETRKGLDIMEEDFEPLQTSSLNIMFKGLNEQEKQEIKERLEKFEPVNSVDYEPTDAYNKEDYTLYQLQVDAEEDSETASKLYNEITEEFHKYEIATSGGISDRNRPVLETWIVFLAVGCALVILILMSGSYVEPFLFLFTILIGILLNKGTNLIFESVSHITESITAILQLALSMDYSIMLMTRYNQEKAKTEDKISAMKSALYHAFSSISSSSITTIVGLMALVFMSFTIGRDLGFVLAKGVLFSLISIFCVLPALILIFDRWIEKTQKKSPSIHLSKLGKFSYAIRPISIVIFVIAFGISFFLKGNLGILYTESEDNEVAKIFPENNQMAIIYKNIDEEKIETLLPELEKQDKVTEVLGYGNTIHQKLTYANLAEKLNDLGADVEIEDDLLKILYYNYYHPSEENTMTFEQFIHFIQTQVYQNDKMSDQLDEQTRKNIDRLAQFTTKDSMNQLRTANEIAQILEIEQKQVDDVLIYYQSKNNHLKLSVAEFIDFIHKDVLTNAEYAGKIDASSREDLDTLSKFTNRTINDTKLSSQEMASLFTMNANTMADLYRYYISISEINVRMTIAEFSNFVLKEMLPNPQYASNFDEATINNITLLNTFSNPSIITKQMNSTEIANLLGIEEKMVTQLLLLKYSNTDTGNTLSITEFIQNVMWLKNNTNYLTNTDLSSLEKLVFFAENKNNINTTKMNQTALAAIFNQIRPQFVETIYLIAGLSEEDEMSPQEFIHLVLTTLGTSTETSLDQSVFSVEPSTLNQLKLLQLVIDDSVATNKTRYTTTQIAKILGMEPKQAYQLHALVALTQNQTTAWTATPNEFVNLILSNRENSNVSANLTESTIAQLSLLANIMTSTTQQTNYSAQELANFIGIDENKIKSIYTLYQVNHTTLALSPNEFVDFILAHKDDSTLSGNLSATQVSDLQLVQSVMNGVKVGQKYTSTELADLLGIDQEDLELLYGLYVSKHVDKSPKISLQKFVTFLLENVITNPEYADNFDQEKTAKLNTIKGIMNATLNQTVYTKEEIFTILAILTDSIDKNTVDLLYVYYGSDQEYDENWTMTVEDFVTFLNQEILQDARFEDFIDTDMRQNIIQSQDTIQDAKKLLIGNGYSRIVLNTEFEAESNETFAFIQMLKDLLNDKVEEVYVIGDSPMAYEMSASFNGELDFITVLTMIAIFVVVAITFKSLIIPFVLVLMIQGAVYLTMGILSVSGGTVYFIALLIVQSILMGATIDYAILYTSYYVELRKTMHIKEAIINSYNKSIHTILTSASILVIVTLIVGHFASAIAAKICTTISQGTLCSTILILLLLPAVIAACDKFVIKKNKKSA